MTPLDRYQRLAAIRAVARVVKRRQYTARARVAAMAEGKCSRCASRPSRPEHTTCRECAEQQRGYTATRREVERCKRGAVQP